MALSTQSKFYRMCARSILLSGFLLLSVILAGQNWQPLNLAFDHHFQLPTDDYISRTIAVDSSGLAGVDSVYYLNRIVTDCDTCPVPFSKKRNQAQFLQKKMWFSGDGNYLFTDPDTFLIQAQAGVGASWAFDPTRTAMVTALDAGITFGQPDSIKTITLSDGSFFQLSKNFGLLNFQSGLFTLVGLGGPGLGEQLPGFFDFFNFEVGDVFQYEQEAFFLLDGFRETFKWTVQDKWVYPDSVVYQLGTIIRAIEVLGGFYVDTFYQEYTFFYRYDRPGDFTEARPLELAGPFFSLELGTPVFSFVRVDKDEEGRVVKQVGGYTPGGPLEVYLEDDSDPERLIPAPLLEFNLVRKAGIGETLIHLSFFEDLFRRELIGYVQGGDTTGIVYSDEALLSSTREVQIGGLEAGPNPSVDFFYVQWGRPLGQEAELIVCDVLGRTFFRKVLSGGEQGVEIDAILWPPGRYFCTLRTSKWVYTIQLVRQKQ